MNKRKQSSIFKLLACILILWPSLSNTSAQNNETDQIVNMQWSSDSQYLALTVDYRSISVYDAKKGQITHKIAPNIGSVNVVSWNASNDRLAIQGADGNVEIWELDEYELIDTIHIDSAIGLQPFWSPDDRYLVLAGGTERPPNFFVLDLESGDIVYEDYLSPTPDAQWSHDGQKLAISAVAPHILLFNINQFSDKDYVGLTIPEINERIDSGQEISNLIIRLNWSSDDQYILTGAVRGEVTVWDVATNEIIYQAQSNDLDPQDPANSQMLGVADVWFSLDGNTFNSIAVDGTYRRWDSASGDLRVDLKVPLNAPMSFGQTSPDTTRFAYVDYENGLYILTIADLIRDGLLEKTGDCISNEGIRTSLLAKLENDHFEAFINEVEAQHGNQIDETCADELLGLAVALQDTPLPQEE